MDKIQSLVILIPVVNSGQPANSDPVSMPILLESGPHPDTRSLVTILLSLSWTSMVNPSSINMNVDTRTLLLLNVVALRHVSALKCHILEWRVMLCQCLTAVMCVLYQFPHVLIPTTGLLARFAQLNSVQTQLCSLSSCPVNVTGFMIILSFLGKIKNVDTLYQVMTMSTYLVLSAAATGQLCVAVTGRNCGDLQFWPPSCQNFSDIM